MIRVAPRRPFRAAAAGVGGVVAALALACSRAPDPRPSRSPPPRVAPDVCALLLHGGKPLEPGRNAVGSTVTEHLYDALTAALGGPPTVGPPANEDDFAALAALAAHGGGAGAVPRDAVVAAGRGPAVLRRFAADVAARLGDPVAAPDLELADDAVAGFAAVVVEPPTPPGARAVPGAFAGAAVACTERTVGADGGVSVHGGDAPDAAFAVVLAAPRADVAVVVAVVPRPPTLDAGWAAAAALQARPPRPTAVGDVVVLPRVAFRVERSIPAWAGAPVQTPAGSVGRLGALGLRVDLGLDRSVDGAVGGAGDPVRGRAGDPDGAGPRAAPAPGGRRVVVDRPFVLAVVPRGAARPTLVAWIERADGLVPVSPATAGP